ncbi:MAG: hypothetical protein HYS17_01795 [Micavibrio aeruginosavorus]|uniref:Uncharacterized protein n=1 Tax=Micavibrio aeruginosavorus TaxID=349221 RepID=A0A7T5UI19_9BACT|nr:MAG: hypothetical protein HYS17_01795 [Micavibrio aeruginosavorus]
MDPVLENARSQLVAIDAVERLHDAFKIVSLFLEDPQRSIKSADQSREYNEHRQIKSESGRFERHRAKQSLLLSVSYCLSISQRLNELALTVASFKPSVDDKDGDNLLMQVLETGRQVETCISHVGNCLNVIKGREKKLLKPDTPAL